MMNYIINKEETVDHQVKRSRVYVSSNLIDLVDDWFMNREIYKLKFKSKSWTSVSRKVNRMINKIIVDNIEKVNKSTYSKRCGCQCGCSPGYILDGHTNSTFNLNIEFGSNTLDEVKEFLLQSDKKLSQEKRINEGVNKNKK